VLHFGANKPKGKSVRNPLKARLAAGGVAVGTWTYIGHPDVAEMLGRVGYDWLLFDLEHGALTIDTLQVLLQASAGGTATPLVRVPVGDPIMVGKALDAGAHGIVFPMVSTREDAERAVLACKYPPLGLRGMAPRRCAAYGDVFEEYVATANDEILVVVMIETPQAVTNLDKILSVPGVDAALVGTGDLSMLMGHFADRNHPEFQGALRAILDACRRHGVVPGMGYTATPAKANEILEMGFRLIGVGQDDDFLLEGARAALRGVRRT
jgi:2-keto-3-deoxy-L-rhamnonate aldolase RhmA